MSDLSSSVLVQHMHNSLTVLLPCIQANEGDCCNQRSAQMDGVTSLGKQNGNHTWFSGEGECVIHRVLFR